MKVLVAACALLAGCGVSTTGQKTDLSYRDSGGTFDDGTTPARFDDTGTKADTVVVLEDTKDATPVVACADAGTRTGRCELRGNLGPIPDVVTKCIDVYESAPAACVVFKCEAPMVWVPDLPCENWNSHIGAAPVTCQRRVSECCETITHYWKDAPDACP
jgi:hypothetical protein